VNPPTDSVVSAAYLESEGAAEDYVDEKVDGAGFPLKVDRVLSVSALPETETVPWECDLMDVTFSEGDPHGS